MLNLISHREMLIIVIMRYHYRAPEWLELNRLPISSVNKDVQHCWWECELEKPLWKTVWALILKSNICMFHGTAIPLLNIYSTVMCAHGHQMTCTEIFIITQNWKQFKCPLTAELIQQYDIVIQRKPVHQ